MLCPRPSCDQSPIPPRARWSRSAGYTASEVAERSIGAMKTLQDQLALPKAIPQRLGFLGRRLVSLAAQETAAAASSDGLENGWAVNSPRRWEGGPDLQRPLWQPVRY